MNDPDAVLVAANADLDEASRSVGPEVEHDVVVLISDAKPVAQRVADVGVGDTVFAGARSDRRLGQLPRRQGYVDGVMASREP